MRKPIFKTQPEKALQEKIIRMLRDRGWFVRHSHGNAFQKGWPDLFCYHPEFKLRWIDVKVPSQHKFTKSQCIEWPRWEAGGVGIWILMDATEEWYAKLFRPPNFRDYWRPAYDKYVKPIEEILDEIT